MSEKKIPDSGRILGVDYGDVRTGLAVSDPSRVLASGLATIKPGGMRRTAEAVAAEAEKQGATLIVIGLPKNMDGTEGFRAETVRAFAALLADDFFCKVLAGSTLIWELPDHPGAAGEFITAAKRLDRMNLRRFAGTMFISGEIRYDG